jgi:sialic acid synthase SpsE
MYHKTKIIAEPAIYWHGDRNLLNDTLTTAAVAGCEMFKVQWFDTKYIGKDWKKKAPFYERCEFTIQDIIELKKKCEKENMELVVTANHPCIIDRLQDSSVYNVKIASGQIEERIFERLADYKWDKVFVSTGMLADLKKLELLKKVIAKTEELTLFHCVSLYPHEDVETNLLRMDTLIKYVEIEHDLHGIKRGYSDHASDDFASIGAMFMGADYLERHMKLPNSYGPTSEIASTPDEMKRLTYYRERISRILGEGELQMQQREFPNMTRYSTRWKMV